MKTTLVTLLVTLVISFLLISCESYEVDELTEIPVEVTESIQAAVDKGHRPGVIIGLVNPKGIHYYSYGTAYVNKNQPITKDSQFAIGSITKLFTVEVLEEMVNEGKISYQTKVSEIWPEIKDGSDTELWQLAAHKAKLPRKIPFAALEKNDPKLLMDTLKRRDALPAENQYSNAGMAILGLTLARIEENELASVMNDKVFEPLHMSKTGYVAEPARKVGLHQVMQPISQKNGRTVEIARGSGGLYSTAEDLVRFISHQINNPTLSNQLSEGRLGWKLHKDKNFVSYYHGGDGGGNQAFIGYRPDTKVGVVLLSNSSADDELQQVAIHLLDTSIELPTFKTPPAKKYSDEELSPYVGVYVIEGDEDGNTFTIENSEGSLIYIERTNEGDLVRRTKLYEVAKHQFKLAEMPLTIDFSGMVEKQKEVVMQYQQQTYTLEKN